MTGLEIAGVVNLAVGFLEKHGDDIIGFVDKAMGLADRAVGAMEKTATSAGVQTEALMAIARSQDQLKRTIKQSTEILGTLIKSESLAIIEKMERDRARSAIDDLKAAVTAMKAFLAETNISKELTDQIVTQHLTPVRHYMIKASNILDESEDKNLGSCCRIVGLTALVAVYEYLGQNVAEGIKKELGDELLTLQKRMLTQYARSLLVRGEEFDWERVPEMLSVKGAEALAQRLIGTGEVPEETEQELPDPRGMSVSEAKAAVSDIADLDTLIRFVGLEHMVGRKDKAPGGRDSVLMACYKKWDELAAEQVPEEKGQDE